MTIGVAASVLIGVAGIALWQFKDEEKTAMVHESGEPPAATVAVKSVAVLPFRAISNGPDDEYFAPELQKDLELRNSFVFLDFVLNFF